MASEPSSEKFRWRMSKRHKNGGFLNNLVAAIKGWMEERGTSLKVSVPRLVLFCVVLISLFLAMTPPSLLVPVPFVVGQTFPYDIRAHRTVRYMSEIATERRRQAVAQAIPRNIG
jgi:cyclic-di-AMP phosphodiesterase PgpH